MSTVSDGPAAQGQQTRGGEAAAGGAAGGGKKPSEYKDTLNLPQTPFAMEAKLVSREPERLARWHASDLYGRVQRRRQAEGAAVWMLHDGPPFANGDIHMGHLTNKVLKDVLLRYKTMAGFATPYVPGWDCHGLPIEHKIQQELGPKLRELSTVEVRRRCWAYAEKYAKLQSEQFQRLGVLGAWDEPYWTMSPAYEAGTLEVFAKFVEAGLVYKQLKPVQWSVANQTALADAELEYQDVDDTSVYVEFAVANPGKVKADFGLRVNAPVGLVVWTTTPWTLPANLAVAVGPEVVYAFCHYSRDGRGRISVVAEALAEKVLKEKVKVGSYTVIARASGRELMSAGVTYLHPFVQREGRVVTADYVTTTDGTGLVHTAPGHGEEDYETGRAYGLEVYCPVLANGRYDTSVPNWLQGMLVWDANAVIVEKLRESGHLLADEVYRHPYPHDWRSKTKTIFRATEQWFIAMDKPFSLDGQTPRTLRERALEQVRQQIRFVPGWGRARLEGMLLSRPDWCISRQRAWGLPIPVFYNEQGEALLTPQSVRAVARRFAEAGSDAWFNDPPEVLLKGCDVPASMGPVEKLRKEDDIFDVWFESGSSWHAVLRQRGLKFPADLYLEGSDQHRGWFQLSLLPSLGATGQSPYREVLTHGFIVKPDGTKVSKSDKEYVTAMQEVGRHGADLLRLWVCSMDYQGDLPASPKVFTEFADKYRKIRNTIRYLLSNLYDFALPDDPAGAIRGVPLRSLDGWALAETDGLVRQVRAAYDDYALHRAFRLLHDFCAVQISAVYANAMKDRLYCEAPDSPLRRRCQLVLWRMADVLVRLLAPMIVFTADEAWEVLPRCGGDRGDGGLDSVHLARLPEPLLAEVPAQQQAEWQQLMKLRDDALLQLDQLKKSVGLNKALDAEIVYRGDGPWLADYGVDLEDLAGCGCHRIEGGPGPLRVEVLDRRTTPGYAACARSWKRRPDVGSDPAYPDLSVRDAAAVRRVRAAGPAGG
ncbi:MAG: isoleucine--tRNA ligase [Tepidisphaerales bacterium]